MSAHRGVEVALVVPLEDPRGDVVEHLRSWTHGQTLARSRYQVVTGADGNHPEFERRVAEILAPQDRIARASGRSIMSLYAAAADAAEAPLLVFTEAHCRAEPECLAAVLEAFAAEPSLGAARLQQRQNATTAVGALSRRWFDGVYEAWEEQGWPRLEIAGCAIRADTYTDVGGLDPELEIFALSRLAARLHERDVRVTQLSDAVVTHELEHGMRESLSLSRSFARGECKMRRGEDPRWCERYFGPAGLWDRRLAYRLEVARGMVAALRSAIKRGPGDRRWLTRELIGRLPAGAAGSRPRRAWERTATAFTEATAAATFLPETARWRAYETAHRGTVRAVQLKELGSDNGLPPAAPLGAGPIAADRLGDALIGAHGLEPGPEREFRWTEPVASIRLAVPEGGGLVRIETDGIRADPLEYLHSAHLEGRPIPADRLRSDGEALEIALGPEHAKAAAGSGLILLSRPLTPPGDSRRLGMPVSAIAVSPAMERDRRSRAP